ncbi:MAG TPA: metal-dependent hydrolase, partial [Pyrinomonadaceae bacterium]|nr:metal-dependent hydrolase [Pyrinomonadaceae bacterium]
LPIAHGLLGASIVAAMLPDKSAPARNWKPLFFGAALASAPDLDYFLKTSQHRGFTHSIIFALIVGCACFVIRGAANIRLTIGYAVAALSHCLLDYAATKAMPGVELFWPISTRRFGLGVVDYYRLTGVDPVHFLSKDVSADLLKMAWLELLIFVPLFLLVLFVKWSINRRTSS